MQELTFTYQPKDYSYCAKEIICIDRISIYFMKLLAIPFFISLYTSIIYGGIYLYLSLILMFILAFIVLKLFINHIIKLQKDIAYDVTLKLDDEKLFVSANSEQSIQITFDWNLIKDIYNTRHLLIIFVSNLQCLIIPKRIFNSNDEIENCWKYIQACYNNAQKKV